MCEHRGKPRERGFSLVTTCGSPKCECHCVTVRHALRMRDAVADPSCTWATMLAREEGILTANQDGESRSRVLQITLGYSGLLS